MRKNYIEEVHRARNGWRCIEPPYSLQEPYPPNTSIGSPTQKLSALLWLGFFMKISLHTHTHTCLHIHISHKISGLEAFIWSVTMNISHEENIIWMVILQMFSDSTLQLGKEECLGYIHKADFSRLVLWTGKEMICNKNSEWTCCTVNSGYRALWGGK